MKRLIFILFISLIGISLNAQDEIDSSRSIKVDYKIDLVSRYVWRGLQFDASPCIQPDLSFSFGNLSIGSWASYGTHSNFPEIDLYAVYSIKSFSLTIFDYYNENENNLKQNKFFNWKRTSTKHAIEGTIAWNGSNKIPLKVFVATFLYGNDLNADNNQNFSTYLEFAYSFKLDNYMIDMFIGGTASNGFYNQKAGIINVGINASKEVKITDNFLLPVKASFTINPESDDVFFVVEITLK